jgi:Nucleotidyltransferase domain
MDTKRSGPQAPRLAEIRSRWLDAVIAALQDDQQVVGAALVGSLGGGRADNWSDIDLLVVVEDAALEVIGVSSIVIVRSTVERTGLRGARPASEHHFVVRQKLGFILDFTLTLLRSCAGVRFATVRSTVGLLRALRMLAVLLASFSVERQHWAH